MYPVQSGRVSSLGIASGSEVQPSFFATQQATDVLTVSVEDQKAQHNGEADLHHAGLLIDQCHCDGICHRRAKAAQGNVAAKLEDDDEDRGTSL